MVAVLSSNTRSFRFQPCSCLPIAEVSLGDFFFFSYFGCSGNLVLMEFVEFVHFGPFITFAFGYEEDLAAKK